MEINQDFLRLSCKKRIWVDATLQNEVPVRVIRQPCVCIWGLGE